MGPGRDEIKQIFGHAAILIRATNGRSAGISFGGSAREFKHGLRGFVSDYFNMGRSVTFYRLGTSPEQDARMIAFLNKGYGAGTDRNEPWASLMLRENCAKAVCNTLEAGGLLADAEDVLGYFDDPDALQKALEEGELSQYVVERVSLEPEKPRLQLHDVQRRSDAFAGTGFCSADGVCH